MKEKAQIIHRLNTIEKQHGAVYRGFDKACKARNIEEAKAMVESLYQLEKEIDVLKWVLSHV